MTDISGRGDLETSRDAPNTVTKRIHGLPMHSDLLFRETRHAVHDMDDLIVPRRRQARRRPEKIAVLAWERQLAVRKPAMKASPNQIDNAVRWYKTRHLRWSTVRGRLAHWFRRFKSS